MSEIEKSQKLFETNPSDQKIASNEFSEGADSTKVIRGFFDDDSVSAQPIEGFGEETEKNEAIDGFLDSETEDTSAFEGFFDDDSADNRVASAIGFTALEGGDQELNFDNPQFREKRVIAAREQEYVSKEKSEPFA